MLLLLHNNWLWCKLMHISFLFVYLCVCVCMYVCDKYSVCCQGAANLHTLKEELAELIPAKQKEVKEFRQKHDNTKIGEVTVGMVSANTDP